MAKKKGEEKVGGENISNTEWGMVIGVLLVIDLLQIGLDFAFGAGIIVNRLLDVAVGLAWSTYLKLRGVNFDAKKVLSIGATFGLEMLPGIDMLPLWTLDGILIFALVKAEKELKKVAKVAIAVAAVALAPETGGASVAAAGAAEGAVAAGAEGAAAGVEGAAAGAGEAGGAAAEGAEGASGGETQSGGSEAEGGDEPGEEGDTENPEEEDAPETNNEEGEGNEPPKENETTEEKQAREERNKNKKNKRQPQKNRGGDKGSGGGSLFGGGQTDGEAGATGSDPLNLRGGSQEGSSNRDALKTRSNLLDLSLSYGARKKQRNDADDQSFSA